MLTLDEGGLLWGLGAVAAHLGVPAATVGRLALAERDPLPLYSRELAGRSVPVYFTTKGALESWLARSPHASALAMRTRRAAPVVREGERVTGRGEVLVRERRRADGVRVGAAVVVERRRGE